MNYENKSFDENNNNDHDDESMFVKTQFNDFEWGGPLRGGTHLEPTRFSDWEQKVVVQIIDCAIFLDLKIPFYALSILNTTFVIRLFILIVEYCLIIFFCFYNNNSSHNDIIWED